MGSSIGDYEEECTCTYFKITLNVSVFDWYQYVLGILGGWMAGVYGGFTPVPNLLIRGISSHFILFTHS
jgi:hypothetical protein